MVKGFYERLYLAKHGNDSKGTSPPDVYVEKCPFVQHQLDGIRFLYKAFIKKKPGVILNDPSGYGKRVTTALFLSAVVPTLETPVLVLCKEGWESLWVEHFLKWTQVSNDVSVELTNPFVKKKILVTPSYNAAAFARRDWSVIIVDDWLSKDLLKATLRAGLRVWITSTNVKVDLPSYSTFHSWIYPKSKFRAEKFEAKAHDLRDAVAKAVMVDAFLEDTVLRRANLNTPFTTQMPIQAVEKEEKPRVTKKNKDASGTKIKRTKRKSIDTENTEDIAKKVARIENINKNNDRVNVEESKKVEDSSEGFKTGAIDTNDEELSQLKFKRNKKRIVLWDSDISDSEDVSNVTKLQENDKINTTESQSLRTLRYDSDSDSDSNRYAAIHISNELNNTHTVTADSNYVSKIIDDKKDKVEDVVEYAKDEMNEIPIEVKNIKFSEDLFSTDLPNNIRVDEIIENAQELEVKNETANQRENERTVEVKPDNAALSSFDLKFKQLEELTLKKFKGTFFDSIF